MGKVIRLIIISILILVASTTLSRASDGDDEGAEAARADHSSGGGKKCGGHHGHCKSGHTCVRQCKSKCVEDDDDNKAGGLGPEQPADSHVRKLVKKLAPEIRERICSILNEHACDDNEAPIKTIAYREQIVSGSMYYVSVSMDQEIFHVKIYEQTWTNTLELEDVEGPKDENDAIEYF